MDKVPNSNFARPRPSKRLRSQAGQVIVENVLLLVVLIGVFTAIVDTLKKENFATTFTEGPWKVMDGMIECGVWVACGLDSPKAGTHPNAAGRVLSLLAVAQ